MAGSRSELEICTMILSSPLPAILRKMKNE